MKIRKHVLQRKLVNDRIIKVKLATHFAVCVGVWV